MSDFQIVFDELELEQLSELLENIEVKEDMLLNERIKQKTLPQLTGEEEAKEAQKKKAPHAFKILPIAAALIIFVAGAVVAITDIVKPEYKPTVTETTTKRQSGIFDNPLMLAISSGNEALIDTLIKNTMLLTQDVLEYALECADVISYTSLQHIARAVEETVGTTGLDALLESTLYGDSERALEELKKREKMLMTPLERLSFFFSAAFCDSDVIEEFIEKGFDVELKDITGKTVSDIAKKYGNEENLIKAEKSAE